MTELTRFVSGYHTELISILEYFVQLFQVNNGLKFNLIVKQVTNLDCFDVIASCLYVGNWCFLFLEREPLLSAASGFSSLFVMQWWFLLCWIIWDYSNIMYKVLLQEANPYIMDAIWYFHMGYSQMVMLTQIQNLSELN